MAFVYDEQTETYSDDLDTDIKVKVGGSTDLFEPEIEVSKWDEISFKAKLRTKTNQSSILEDDIISTSNIKLYKHLEKKLEFDISFSKKPKTNIIEFDIETEGLEFLYQPLTLSQHEIDNNCSRPDDVKGSYAVYYQNCPPNILGGKVYGTGKVCHIFRPKIFDSTGAWVWGELNIDVPNKLLTVTIPQGFLDNAEYPVTQAAGLEIGWTGEGGTVLGVAVDRIYTFEVSPGGASGDISKLTIWCYAGAVNYKAIIIDTAGGASSTIISNGIGSVDPDDTNWTKHQQDIVFGATKPQYIRTRVSV